MIEVAKNDLTAVFLGTWIWSKQPLGEETPSVIKCRTPSTLFKK